MGGKSRKMSQIQKLKGKEGLCVLWGDAERGRGARRGQCWMVGLGRGVLPTAAGDHNHPRPSSPPGKAQTPGQGGELGSKAGTVLVQMQGNDKAAEKWQESEL